MTPVVRNVLLIAVIAAAVAFLPGGGDTAAFVGGLLSVAITASFAWIGIKLYREHRTDIFGLGDQYRGIFYGGLGLAIFAMAARAQLFTTGAGVIAWFAMIAAASYALVMVWRHWRSYSY